MTTVEFNVHGMGCEGCAETIIRQLMSLPGVTSAEASLPQSTVTVNFDEASANADSLEKVIEALGYDVIHGTGRTTFRG